MKVSGFTFIRNGCSLGYPFIPAIQSLLPLCDEIIVDVPRSTDETLAIVQKLGNPKIRILETEWDDNARTGGLALSHHTNLAMGECTGDWCVYVQGDEVLHEDTVPLMRQAMENELNNPVVQGFVVNFTHFYGSYWTQTAGFGWYQQEVRIVRRDPRIRSWSDAQGFRTADGKKLQVKNSGGHYFHYGHARHPEMAAHRLREVSRLWHDDTTVEKICDRPADFYESDQKVRPFTGTHPVIMRDVIAAANWTYHSQNPLIRFNRRYFWKDIAWLIKMATGIEIGVHRNFRLIR